MSLHPVTEFIPPSTWSLIEIRFSAYAKDLLANLVDFVKNECLPAEHLYHAQIPEHPFEKRWATVVPVMEDLKKKAKARGLWNLFLSKQHYPEHGVDLTNLEYAVFCEIMGHAPLVAPQATNCAAPDTGNMEVFARYGNPEQQAKYLTPLLNGEIRSSFAMTEFGVASSDATNLRGSIRKEGGKVIVNARKWWISGAGDPRNKIHILIGLSDPENPSPHKRHTIVLIPPSTKGVKVVRPLKVFGYDDAPEGHCEVLYDNVVLDEKECIVGGWGRGFEIIQGRLGPGRIHHCMRSIGSAQRALDMMLTRVSDPVRKTFGKYLREHGTILTEIAKSRAEIDQARLLVLTAAHQIDVARPKGAMKDIGVAKFTVPSMALRVVDRAMQSFGAEGISQDQPLAQMYAGLRTLRYADGPDEVHLQQIGKQELKRVPLLQERNALIKQREAQLMREAKL
ncbi:hypothetical protein NliqN6_3702 [Naganishia liquefaciens]|uniref:Acyl-CoA dehydrogenase n=1 Tax=Naganishia liquefaciens TaxID=104408 RepID=A0A8H3TV71_9TREE|nr:hypothetical protein NliqN6_3702 [Naganishia liquefaciens]